MASFEFATATRVVFGAGSVREAPAAVRGFGARRVLLVTGASPARAEPLRAALGAERRRIIQHDARFTDVTQAMLGITIEAACEECTHRRRRFGRQRGLPARL